MSCHNICRSTTLTKTGVCPSQSSSTSQLQKGISQGLLWDKGLLLLSTQVTENLSSG